MKLTIAKALLHKLVAGPIERCMKMTMCDLKIELIYLRKIMKIFIVMPVIVM